MADFGAPRTNTVPKLKGAENYKIWKAQVNDLIEGNGLRRYLNGKKLKPVKLPDESEDEFEDRYDEWLTNDAKARAIIRSNCIPDIISDLHTLATAKEQWEFLEQQYQPRGAAHQIGLFQEFYSVHFDGKDLDSFCSKYRASLLALAEADLKIDDRIQVFLFLTLVSPYFEAWAANKRQSFREITDKADLPKLEQLIADLMDENKAQKDIAAANMARHGANKQNSAKTPSQNANRPHCSAAKCVGHLYDKPHTEDNCWSLHPELRMRRGEPKKTASTVATPAESQPSQAPQTHKTFYVAEESLVALKAAEDTSSWVLDSGCSTHMTHDGAAMNDLTHINATVQCGKGSLRAKAMGSITLALPGNRVTFTDVLWVPELVANLISTESLRQKGLFYRNDEQVLFLKNGEVIAHIYVHNKLPHLRLDSSPAVHLKAVESITEVDDIDETTLLASSRQASNSKASLAIWHQRTHAPAVKLLKAVDVSTGMVVTDESSKLGVCSTCKQSDGKRIISRIPSRRPEVPYEECCTDTVTVSEEGIGRAKYFTLFTDSATLYRHQYPSPSKDGVKHHFKQHDQYISTQLGRRTQRYRMDGGTEFGGLQLHEYAQEHGIKLQITTPHNSGQNGRAEVSNNVTCVLARKLMLQGQLPKFLWPYALETAIMLLNLLPSDTLNGKSPYQALAEREGWPVTVPYLGFLRAYGCKAFVLDHGVKRGDKFAPRSRVGQLVGYQGTNIYQIWVANEHRIIRSTNVTFDESTFEPDIVDPAYEGASLDDYLPVSEAFPSLAKVTATTKEKTSEDTMETPAPSGGERVAPAGGETAGPSRGEVGDEPSLETVIPQLGKETNAIAPRARRARINYDSATRKSSRERQKSTRLLESEAAALFTSANADALPLKTFHAFTAAANVSEIRTPKTYDVTIRNNLMLRFEVGSYIERNLYELNSIGFVLCTCVMAEEPRSLRGSRDLDQRSYR